MATLSQSDRELISAYLDDALDGSERAEAELLLSENDVAVGYLTELRQTRNRLKLLGEAQLAQAQLAQAQLAQAQLAQGQLAQGQVPQARFTVNGSLARSPRMKNLAQRVLEQAQAQAAAEGLSANHHVRKASVSAPVVTQGVQTADALDVTKPEFPNHHSNSRWWMWSSIGALAASLLAVAYLKPWQTPDLNPLAQLPNTPVVVEPAVVGPVPGPDVVGPGDLPKATTTESPRIVASGPIKPNELHEPANIMALDYLFICDIVMSQQGWDSGQFDRLLDKLSVPQAADIPVKRDLIQAMVDSETIVARDGAGQIGSDIVLFYVNSQADIVERMAVAIENDKNNFRSFQYNMAIGFDTKFKNLIDKLHLYVKSTQANPRGAAHLLVVQDSQGVGGMVPAVNPPQIDAQLKVTPGMLGARQPDQADQLPAELLIILRRE